MESATVCQEKKGLSNFQLKYLALFLMVLDHIHYFFEFTGKIPLFFSQLGRVSAPLFLFCLVEGFIHTADRRRYFTRIYLVSVLMGAIHFSFYNIGSVLVRSDGFFPQNQMLSSFVILLAVLQGIEWCADKKWALGISAVVIPVLLPFMASPFLNNARTGFLANFLAFTFLPLHMAIFDGGTAALLTGIIFYLFRSSRMKQILGFSLFVVLWCIVRVYLTVPEVTIHDFFSVAYEWMEIFAVIPILCYSGERGKGSKYLFYWFYPLHIYALYGLSCIWIQR